MLLSYNYKYTTIFNVLVVEIFSNLVSLKTNTEAYVSCEDNNTYTYEGKLYEVKSERYPISGIDPVPFTQVTIIPCLENEHVRSKVLEPEEVFKSHDRAHIWDITLPPMKESAKLTEVIYRDATPRHIWGHCVMTFLSIEHVNTSYMPAKWLANCTKLRVLDLRSVSVLQARGILDTTSGVPEVRLSNVDGLADILGTPLFPTPRGVEKQIYRLEVSIFYEHGELSSDAWAQVSAAFVKQLSILPRLHELTISARYFHMCAESKFSQVTFKNLRFLDVSGTQTSYFCFDKHILLPNVTEMWFQFNMFNEIVIGTGITNSVNLDRDIDKALFGIKITRFRELFSSPAPKFNLTFDTRTILRLRFSREDYLSLTNGFNKAEVSIFGKFDVDCDCGASLWLARAMRENLVKLNKITCVDQSSIERLQCEMIECNRVYCAGPCVCCGGDNGTVSADCRGTRQAELPGELLQGSNLTHILAPSTGLTTLPNHLPDSLKFLDLSGNNVLLGSTDEEVRTLFKEPRTVRLAGNKLVCVCDNKPLLKVLHENRDQIEDYEDITCVDDGRKLTKVNLKALCASRDRDTAVMMSVSVALVVSVAGLALGTGYYYRRQLQIFLFARGWCLGCIQEEELDADMEYDVFLSFCHADEQLVVEQLLRRLDSEYSVCVHFRDWCVGEGIPVQIARSVERARRTLVALSRGFVASLWGPLEFRTAHARALAEGRTRLVLLVLDDVLCAELDADIRAYVRLNTYLQWGDPFFWDKLKFALPHHPRPRVKHEYVVSNESNHGVIRMNMLEN